MNAIHPAAAMAGDPSAVGATLPSAAAILAGASMADLVTLGRLYFAAINCRDEDDHADDRAEEMSVLASFDDELSSLICLREPRDAQEYGVKAAYLFARVREGGMSDAVEDEALQSLERDARAMAGLPPIPSTDTQGDDQ